MGTFLNLACRLLGGMVQGRIAHRPCRLFLSQVESAMGSVPDWRRRAYWLEIPFMQAWVQYRRGLKTVGMAFYDALNDMVEREWCAVTSFQYPPASLTVHAQG